MIDYDQIMFSTGTENYLGILWQPRCVHGILSGVPHPVCPNWIRFRNSKTQWHSISQPSVLPHEPPQEPARQRIPYSAIARIMSWIKCQVNPASKNENLRCGFQFSKLIVHQCKVQQIKAFEEEGNGITSDYPKDPESPSIRTCFSISPREDNPQHHFSAVHQLINRPPHLWVQIHIHETWIGYWRTCLITIVMTDYHERHYRWVKNRIFTLPAAINHDSNLWP